MIVDAGGQVLGRMASYVAKQALLGQEVIVVNAEKAVISGRREDVLEGYLTQLEIRNKGNYRRGPFHQKRPDKFVRRSIRGMLPWHTSKGQEAFKRVMVYLGAPQEEIMKNHGVDLNKEKPSKVDVTKGSGKYLTVAEVCRFIGGKW